MIEIETIPISDGDYGRLSSSDILKKFLPERLGIRLLKADRQGELHHSAKNEVHR